MTLRAADVAPAVVEGCTRGGDEGGDWVGTREGYTGTPPSHPRTRILNIFSHKAYLRPNEGKSQVFMRFLRLGLEWVSELT